MVALATAFVRLRPQVDSADINKEATKGGKEYGQKFSTSAQPEVGKGIDAGLEAARKNAARHGGEAGKQWGDGFYRDANGKIRDAQGKFVASSITGGQKAGKGYATGFGKGSSGILGSLKGSLSQAAGLFVPLGIAAAVGEIGKIGIAYEDSLNIFRSVSKATGTEMERVAEQARALGNDIDLPGVSAASAAAAMTELAKAGFTVQESMDAAKGTLQLARVANLDEAAAAEIAANAVNAFGVDAKETTFVVDELAAAANSSSLEISEASHSFKQAAAVFSGLQGRVVGPKEAITELNTAIAILGNNGIKGSDAGTSLKQMLLQLTGPSQQAKDQMQLLAARAAGATISLEQQNDVLRGSKSVRQDALEEIKKQNAALDLEGDIAYDSAGRMRPLRDIIDLVAKGTKGMTQAESDYAVTQIFGADASRSVLALLKGGLPVYDDMRKAILTQGAAADFAAAKNAGLGGAIDNVKGKIENAAIEVYNVVKGPLTSSLNSFAESLPGIFDGIRKTFGFLADHKDTVLAVAYAVGLLTVAVKAQAAANAIAAAGGVISFLKAFVVSTNAATAAQTLFNVALDANPIGITILAIGALVGAFILLYKNSETFRKGVALYLDVVKAYVGGIVAFFTDYVVPGAMAAWKFISDGAIWLWKNGIKPAWDGIVAAVRFGIEIVKFYIDAGVATFRFIAGIATWLYKNIFEPVFKAIGKVVEVWWYAVRLVFQALKLFFENVIFPVVRAIYNAVFKPIFDAIGKLINLWWRTIIQPAFNGVKAAFTALGSSISSGWTKTIRPVLNAFGNFVKDTIVPAFKRGVDIVKAQWDRVKEIAKKPIAFVVNQVINPFITGLNHVGHAVGLKDSIGTIKGFASGGLIPGPNPGAGKDNRLASITGTGRPIAVAGKEFITNARSTMANLPLVRAINKKQGKVSHADVDPYLDGGAGDGIGDVWDKIRDGIKGVGSFVTDPIGSLRKVADTALAAVPGAGRMRDVATGAGKRLVSSVIAFVKDKLGAAGGIGGGNVYGGWQGMQRLIAARFPGLGLISGFRPGATTLTGNRSYHSLGRAVDYPANRQLASWIRATFGANTKELITPWQDLNLHNGKPHTYTGAVWNQHNFAGGNAHVHWAAAMGGLIDKMRSGMPVKTFDSGGAWPTGTLGVNTSGRTEYVDPNLAGTSLADVVERLDRAVALLASLGVDLAEAQRTGARRTARAVRSGVSFT